MGSNISKSSLTKNIIDDYLMLTYLTKSEIVQIFDKFRQIDPNHIDNDINYRVPFASVQDQFPELKYNPFADRLCSVFSSKQDGYFSFEDIIDLCSIFSKNCPGNVKALWAFKIFDYNEDLQICKNDINEVIERLTRCPTEPFRFIADDEKKKVSEVLLKEMDLQHSGSISQLEFQHAIGKMPDFSYSFTFNV